MKHDGELPISLGESRDETSWQNTTMKWSELVAKITDTTRTPEKYAEFMNWPKTKQDARKDIGGFVGGHLNGGRRKKGNVACRQLVTLDADYAPPDFTDDLDFGLPFAYAVYSTHKHCPEKPRLRILIPLDREVSPDEYEAISRKIADSIIEGKSIEYFDDTTYEPNRLMFWPSTSEDGVYFRDIDHADAVWAKADDILKQYRDWTDTSYWPVSSRKKQQFQREKKEAGDPLQKPGWIGAFNRAYTIPAAIETFIPDAYTQCDMENRYTYTGGSTSAGLVVYDDVFAYSHHSTDPASETLCNAFDLVRIHKFGNLDDKQKENTPVDKLKSQSAMLDFVMTDKLTKHEMNVSLFDTEQDDAEESDDWADELVRNKKGELVSSLVNAVLIIGHDPDLNGLVFNELSDSLEILPDKGGVKWDRDEKRFWKDTDDSRMEVFLAQKYTEFSRNRIMAAVDDVAASRRYHPVRAYLSRLPEWDGVHRVDTLLIDYFGAEDNDYVRAVTRKTLCAAIHRVYHPGCKFDTVLVLCGGQGIGKSTLFAKLGQEWFSDSLNFMDTNDKTGAEKLQGCWIMEIGELAGMGRASVRNMRTFITSVDDKYRAAYGRRANSHPRQCILVGTTNSEDGYLNDLEGGRRFWPVNTPGNSDKKTWELTSDDVDQIWAEALVYEKAGEPLILSGSVAEKAKRMQKEAMVQDPRAGKVAAYLDILLPDDWYERSLEERVDFISSAETEIHVKGTMRRDRVTLQEIWCECLRQPYEKLNQKEYNGLKGIMKAFPEWEYTEKRLPRDKAYGGKQVRGFVREETDETEV